MFDEEAVKEIGYRISLSAIFMTTLFLSFIVFYLTGVELPISMALSLILALAVYFTSRKSIEKLRRL